MADNGKPTGNEVASSDFARLLLAVKDSALRDTHCLELAIVKEIEGSKVLCKIISNPDLMIQATRINNMSLNVNQIVLVGFNDNDFKSNLNKYLTNDLTLQKSVNKNRHILTNGIIITNFTEGGSDFSGSYNDLTNKPILNTSNTTSLSPSSNETIENTINLHKISKTGSYLDLLDKPSIPEADSDLTNNRYVRYDINNQNLDATQKQNARTNIDAYSKPSGGIPDSDLAEDYIEQGDTLTKPLTVTGGDSAAAGKIILDQTNNGQITDLTTKTLLGFLNAVDLTVGNATYNLKLRGLQTRPTYNGNDLALLSDIQADTNTWRNISVNDTEILGTGINTGALNLKQGSNVTITNNNGDVTIEATDTGATRLRGYTFSSVLVNDYVNFTTTDEYVNLYIYVSDVLTAVTSSNKDSLSIVPGTTQAYFYTNGFSGNFGNEYIQSNRIISMTNNAKFITGNDVENQLNINSIFPVQNKVIAKLIMSGTSSNNQLANVNFVNSSINALAAFFITRDAQGDNFNTYAQLSAATTFYSGGQARVPTTNDYTYVRWDETKGDVVSGYSSFTTTTEYIGHFVIYNNEGVEVTLANKDSVGITPGTTIAYDNLPTTRYSYQGGVYPVGQWDFQLIVNNSALTAAQIAALNSGITSALVNQIVTNQSNITNLQSNALTNVSYDSTNKKLQQTKSGNTSDILNLGLGTIAGSESVTIDNDTLNLVTRDTAQTISGNKTFSGNINTIAKSSIWTGNIFAKDSNNNNLAFIGFNTNGQVGFQSNQTGNDTAAYTWRIGSINRYRMFDTVFRPESNNTNDLGTSTIQWNRIYGKTIYQNGKQVANVEDIPSIPVTDVQLNGDSVVSNGIANVKALPNYSLSIGSTNGGNPRQVLFCSVNYTNFGSESGAYFKLGAMSGHGNGVSYTFVEDIFINVNYQGTVKCEVYKYTQQSVTLDGVTRNYGDIFWTIDTTNKIVYFYILLGQYSTVQFTPATKIGAARAVTTANGIIQYTGSPTYYSSGTKTWASGNSTLYARKSDGLSYVTTEPTAANTDGLKIAVLSSEPATKYSGWLYFITE